MLKSVKVRDYMTTDLVTFTPGMDLFRAIDKLLMHRISGAPVLDENGYLIGLLSEGDCLKGILAGSYFEEAGGSVASVMTTVVETIDADADIVKAGVRSPGGGFGSAAANAGRGLPDPLRPRSAEREHGNGFWRCLRAGGLTAVNPCLFCRV